MPTHTESPPNTVHCVYCETPLRPDEAIRWGFDELPVCRECYTTLDAIKEERIAAYRKLGTRNEAEAK